MLIRLTSLVCIYKIQKKCCLRARLVSLISTKTKEYIFGRHLCIRSMLCSTYCNVPLRIVIRIQQVVYPHWNFFMPAYSLLLADIISKPYSMCKIPIPDHSTVSEGLFVSLFPSCRIISDHFSLN